MCSTAIRNRMSSPLNQPASSAWAGTSRPILKPQESSTITACATSSSSELLRRMPLERQSTMEPRVVQIDAFIDVRRRHFINLRNGMGDAHDRLPTCIKSKTASDLCCNALTIYRQVWKGKSILEIQCIDVNSLPSWKVMHARRSVIAPPWHQRTKIEGTAFIA